MSTEKSGHSIKKFENIQALRGIAVLLVVICHLTAIESLYNTGIVVLPKFLELGAFGVDIFFVISGFIMASITRGQFQDINHTINFAFHRITRIYPLYWFYTCMFFFLILAQKYLFGHADQQYQYNIIHSLLLLPYSQEPILPGAWTLIFEIYFYCIITLLLFLPERLFVKALVFWLVLVCGMQYFIKPFSPALSIITSPLALEFIAGCLIARLPYRFPTIYNRLLLGVGIFLFIISSYYYHHLNPVTTNAIDKGFMRILFFGVPSMILVYAAMNLEKNRIRFPKFIAKLGDASYSIYLSHAIVYVTVERLWQKLVYNNLSSHIIMLIVMFIAVISYGFISYDYIEKPMITFFRNLIEHRTFGLMAKAK